MDHITIEGVRGYDGTYEFDLDGQPLTTREWGWIKRLAGYLPLNIEEGLTDPELIVVFAAISLRRAGKVEARDVPEAFEKLSDAPFGSSVKLETDTAEESEEEGGEPSPPERNSSLSNGISGRSSSPTSETLRNAQKASGTPILDTTESDQEMSAN